MEKRVTLNPPYTTVQAIKEKLYGKNRPQRQDCAEWDGDLPPIRCTLPAECISNGKVKGYKWEIRAALFMEGRTREVSFDPNGSTIDETSSF